MIVIVLVVLALVFAGVHIAIALGITAALGVYLMLGDITVVRTFVANTAYEALRDYVFAVIPLFMLMGDFLAKCGAARDLYALAQPAVSRWLPARLAVATIISNALFAFVTGVSIAAAAAFSRIAYPEMMRYGYRRDFALGCVAGSACLGMLIPPSVLMIVWGVLTEISIGKLFLAGVHPGPAHRRRHDRVYVVVAAIIKPELAGGDAARTVASAPVGAAAAAVASSRRDEEPIGPLLASTGLVIAAGRRRARRDLVRRLHADRGRRRRRGRRADPGADQGHHAARGLAGHPRRRAHLRPAAAAAVLRAALFARAVDDRLHRGRQDLPARHRARALGHPGRDGRRSGSCSAA